MYPPKFFSRFFNGKLAPVTILALAYLAITFITRCFLLVFSAKGFEWNLSTLVGTFGIGVMYDLVVCSFVIIPMVLHTWFSNERIYQRKWRWVAPSVLLAIFLILKFSQLVPEDFNEDLRKIVLWYVFIRMLLLILLAIAGPSFRVQWRKGVLLFDLTLIMFLLLFNAVSEFFFWQEFSGRYNFIAVDYLVYT
ncbi:MAG TPA: hypothetical protein VLC28_01810, partial [Flavitalea sp.]|nr:hypothetical protein [Flavitalea sp.]